MGTSDMDGGSAYPHTHTAAVWRAQQRMRSALRRRTHPHTLSEGWGPVARAMTLLVAPLGALGVLRAPGAPARARGALRSEIICCCCGVDEGGLEGAQQVDVVK
jgi:hypothetical protein